MPASSQASMELSTASLIVVRSAFEGLSKPSRWRFFEKNSETEISRWRWAMDSAVARRAGAFGAGGAGSGALALGGDTGDGAGAGALGAGGLAVSPNRSSCGRLSAGALANPSSPPKTRDYHAVLRRPESTRHRSPGGSGGIDLANRGG